MHLHTDVVIAEPNLIQAKLDWTWTIFYSPISYFFKLSQEKNSKKSATKLKFVIVNFC